MKLVSALALVSSVLVTGCGLQTVENIKHQVQSGINGLVNPETRYTDHSGNARNVSPVETAQTDTLDNLSNEEKLLKRAGVRLGAPLPTPRPTER